MQPSAGDRGKEDCMLRSLNRAGAAVWASDGGRPLERVGNTCEAQPRTHTEGAGPWEFEGTCCLLRRVCGCGGEGVVL
jgi:hypothetical protein